MVQVLKGWSILYPEFQIVPYLDPYLLAVLFFLTVVPFSVANLVPTWRAASIEPDVVMQASSHLQALGDSFHLQKEPQIVRTPGLGIDPGHFETAERLDSYQGAGDLAVEIEVADLEVTSGPLEPPQGPGCRGRR